MVQSIKCISKDLTFKLMFPVLRAVYNYYYSYFKVYFLSELLNDSIALLGLQRFSNYPYVGSISSIFTSEKELFTSVNYITSEYLKHLFSNKIPLYLTYGLLNYHFCKVKRATK